MTKPRLTHLLLIASLFAFLLACMHGLALGTGLDGMSDGGGLL